MNKKIEDNLTARAELFKALGHPARLLIMNLVLVKPRHGEELAAILNLNPATISHHLSKLTAVGLLTSKKDQYYQVYSLANGILQKRLDEMIRVPQPGMDNAVKEDAYKQKVLRAFIKHGRLVQIPAQQKKRLVVLEHILSEFEPDRDYSEKEVNLILLEYNEDVATLRREMIMNDLMTRDKGIYRRIN